MRNLAARAAMMAKSGGAAGITTSIYNDGSLGSLCYCDFSGNGPLDVTFSFWTNTLQKLGEDCSCALQYGGDNDGSAFATYSCFGGVGYDYPAVLCGGRYWNKYYPTLVLNTWEYHALVLKSTTSPFVVYSNGSKVSAWNTWGTSALNTPTTRFYLASGYHGDNNQRRYNGYVTRCVFWNRILTDAEIAADYALGQTAPTLTSDIIHYWDGTLSNGKFKDLAGDWDLTLGSGCSQSNVTPWSNT